MLNKKLQKNTELMKMVYVQHVPTFVYITGRMVLVHTAVWVVLITGQIIPVQSADMYVLLTYTITVFATSVKLLVPVISGMTALVQSV